MARRAVPQLGEEVGERHHHERQRRVVVVLERGSVDAGPRDPLGGEPDGDQRQREAPAPERHPRDERQRRDPEPPDDEAARVVERGGGAGGEALLVEPDGLEVHRPRPPRGGRRVGRGQAVVIAVHLAGQVEQRLAGVAGRPARDELVVLDHRPRDVGQDVDADRECDQADERPDDRDAQRPAGPEPAVGGRARRVEQQDRVVGSRRTGQRPEPVASAQPEQAEDDQRPEPQGDREQQRRRRERPEGDHASRCGRSPGRRRRRGRPAPPGR